MVTSYPLPSAAPSVPPGILYLTESASPWLDSGFPQPPPSSQPQQLKDSSDMSDQGMNQHNFPCSVHQYESSGTMNNDNSDLLDSQVQYSVEPQLYGNVINKHPVIKVRVIIFLEECLFSDESTSPSIKKKS
jgi:BCL2-associated athanogene 4